MQFFSPATKNRFLDPSQRSALDFKREFRRSAICSVSATIGIDRSIFGAAFPVSKEQQCAKRPSPAMAIDVSSVTICHHEARHRRTFAIAEQSKIVAL
jgi:hypothetical protein